MSVLKSFEGFASRVLGAVKGRLKPSDVKMLEHLFSRTNEKNLILSRGLLSALNITSPSKADIQTLAKVLDNANLRIMAGKKDPFTTEEEKALSKIFVKHGLSPKVVAWMSSQRDLFLYDEISRMATEPPHIMKGVKIEKRKQEIA